jgi:hypothetical protein
MKISIQCQCGKQYQVKPELAGKKVKCQSCGTPIAVPADGASKATPEKPAKKPAAAAAKSKPPAVKTAASSAKPSSATKPAASSAKPSPATKPAAQSAPKAAAPPPAQHSILDEHMADAVRLPTAGEMYCPGCNAIIANTAVLCVNCGYDLQSRRSTKVSSEANRVKRKPGQRPLLGVFVAIVAMLYGLAGAAIFALCIVASAIILVKLGLPNDQNRQSATAMFGLPVHILLSTAGLLMFVSGIGILRYTKGATLNAGLGAKIYFWMLLVLMIGSVGNTIYQSTDRAKEAAAKAETESSKKPPPVVDLGNAERLTTKNLMGLLRMEVLATIIGLFALLLAPPAFIWAWAATQGRQWDWELPEPVHKLKLKPTAKVGGPAETEKK